MDMSLDSYYPGNKPTPVFPFKLSLSIDYKIPNVDLFSLIRMKNKEIEEEMKTLLQKPKYKNWHNRDFPHDFSNLIIELTTGEYPNLGDIMFYISIDKDNVEYKDRR